MSPSCMLCDEAVGLVLMARCWPEKCDPGSVTTNAGRHTQICRNIPSQRHLELQGEQPLGQALRECWKLQSEKGNSPGVPSSLGEAMGRKGQQAV